MADVAKLGFFALALFVESRIWVRLRFVRLVGPLLAMEIDADITVIATLTVIVCIFISYAVLLLDTLLAYSRFVKRSVVGNVIIRSESFITNFMTAHLAEHFLYF